MEHLQLWRLADHPPTSLIPSKRHLDAVRDVKHKFRDGERVGHIPIRIFTELDDGDTSDFLGNDGLSSNQNGEPPLDSGQDANTCAVSSKHLKIHDAVEKTFDRAEWMSKTLVQETEEDAA